MKKAKRNLLIVLLAVAVTVCSAIGLAGCGLFGGGSDDNSSDITYTAEDLKYASKTDDFLMAISGRRYYKANDGNAVVGMVAVNGYTGPILVGSSSNAVSFYSDYSGKSKVFTSNATVSYNDQTYYYSANEHFMSGAVSRNTKASVYYCESTTLEDAANEILKIADISKLALPTISTVEELKALNNSSEGVMLGADIDLSSEKNWTPIENFTGTLNGGGHSIQNLSLTVKSADNVGLFAELKGAVSNLKLENVSITGSGSGNNVGAIAGKNSGTIQSCEVDGTINCEYASCVGGIAGYSNTKIYNNVNNASVTSNEKVGGVAGCIVISGSFEIKSNTNNGSVAGVSYVGGIAGSIESANAKGGDTYTTTISDCENNGTVTATGNYAGGIAGQATGYFKDGLSNVRWTVYIEISDCENKGEVSGKDYVAGIYGYGGDYLKSVTACVNSADINGNNYVGGYIGYSKNTSTSNMNNNNNITGKGYVGGIAGYTGNVQNCKNNGTITSLGTILEDGVNKYCVGGLAGYCTGATNCVNNVDITVELAGKNVGGIAGEIYCNNAIENNTNSGKITALQSTNAGGLAGRVVFTGSRSVNGNTNEANVAAASYVGGIAGIMESANAKGGDTYTTTISDCENNGTVTATGNYAGGIAGQATGYFKDGLSNVRWTVYIEISDCENKGEVSGKDYVAGIYGYGGDYVKSVTACVNSVDIAGNNYVGGYIGYSKNTSTSNMNNNNTITGKGYVGGIAGYAGNVQNCKNNGTVTSLGTILEDGVNKYCVGGIAGYCTGATNCVNNTDITVDLAGRCVGGIAGEIYCKNAIESNTNSGIISASKTDRVGGIVGKITVTGNINIKTNKNEAAVTGASYTGGIAGIVEAADAKGGDTYTTAISDCENNGVITATGSYAGGIAGQATGYFRDGLSNVRWTVYIEISNNVNYEKVTANSSGTRAAIVGKAGDYVNSKNSSLWSSNNDYGEVGRLYN